MVRYWWCWSSNDVCGDLLAIVLVVVMADVGNKRIKKTFNITTTTNTTDTTIKIQLN